MQVIQGKVDRITKTAIQIERIAQKLDTAITTPVRIQKFLDSMHPELRYAVEPEIKDRKTATWKDVKDTAQRKDEALFRAGKYGRLTESRPKTQVATNSNFIQNEGASNNNRNTRP